MAFEAAIALVPPDSWAVPRRSGKWSPAAVVLHVTRAYELGAEAMSGGAGMKLRVAPVQAWLLRELVLPYFLASGKFPRGAKAPREVVPDLEEAAGLGRADASARLLAAAERAAGVLSAAGERGDAPRVAHAYFGGLTPLQAFRLLSAHTQHHARAFAHSFRG